MHILAKIGSAQLVHSRGREWVSSDVVEAEEEVVLGR